MDYNALAALVAQPQYEPLHGDITALRDVLNARPVSSMPNPEPQGVILVPHGSIIEFMAIVPVNEKIAIMETLWRDVALRQYATHEAAVDAINGWIAESNAQGKPIDSVLDEIIDAKAYQLIAPMLAVITADGIISAETLAAIQAAMMQPDPAWLETIYEYGDSPATAAGLDYVSEYDLRKVLNDGLSN